MILALALGLSPAVAQDPYEVFSVDVERFRPHLDGRGFGVTEGASTLGHLEVHVGLWGQYEEDSVVLVWQGERLGDGEEGDGILDRRTTADLQLGLGLYNRLSINAGLPVILWQKGLALEHLSDPRVDEDLIGAGNGDVRVALKGTISDLDDGPVGFALQLEGTVPAGSPYSFFGEGAPTLTPRAVLELADGSVRKKEYTFRIALNAGWRFREQAQYRDLVVDDELVYAGALSVRPAPWSEFGLEVYGAVGGPRAAHRPVELAPFLTAHLDRDLALTLGGAIGLAPGLGTPDFRVFAGGTLSPSFDPRVRDRDKDGIVDRADVCVNIPEDADGVDDLDGCPEKDADEDGILDPEDACPVTPEDLDRFQDEDGCPDLDNDDDGILDPEDACPMAPETVNQFRDEDGCPDEADSDRDGIGDLTDRCPREPEDRDGYEDEDGCPDRDNDRDGFLDPVDACPDQPETWNDWRDDDGCPDTRTDSDGDGILDEVDACPTRPEDLDNFEDEDGCPDVDNDADGIVDVVDACPNDAETVNNFMDDDGCPDQAPSRVRVERQQIVILEQVFFDVDRATIQGSSDSLLDEIAQTLVDHPEIVRLRVEGHTDSDGEGLYNLRLSQARAESVVAALVERGIEADRLEAAGLGESRPIASNGDAAGKARNRRVEFHIVERE